MAVLNFSKILRLSLILYFFFNYYSSVSNLDIRQNARKHWIFLLLQHLLLSLFHHLVHSTKDSLEMTEAISATFKRSNSNI